MSQEFAGPSVTVAPRVAVATRGAATRRKGRQEEGPAIPIRGNRQRGRRAGGRTARSRLENHAVLARPKVLLFRRRYQLAKRVLDVVLSLAVMPLVLPILAACAAAIWINDGGPVVFTQLRTGKGGTRFRMYKFRTMLRNAEELKQKYAHLNELKWPDFKITDDPRVTRVGRFLRRTSLDELPQIFNVLKGEMSLVGPRPTSFAPETYELWHTERLEVLPGITGLWQISGRSDVDFDRRLRLDVEYIEKQSLWLDVRILLGTFTAVLRQRGAY
jgi:lipopolysaccharide/colanic/teichoic acid biosynthesis glycosyltransferase